MSADQLEAVNDATLTIQLAGVTTDAGNADVFSTKLPYYNLPFMVDVNGNELEPWIIP